MAVQGRSRRSQSTGALRLTAAFNHARQQGRTLRLIERLRPGSTVVVRDVRQQRRLMQMIANLRPDLKLSTLSIKTQAEVRAEALDKAPKTRVYARIFGG